jgi:MFS family permease
MTGQSVEAQSVPLALAEPSVHVKPGWVAGLGLATLGMWMAALTPAQVILPIQLQNIDPNGKIGALALVSALGAVSSVIATPVAGALSDRTTGAFGLGRLRGRRHRWTLAMALLGAVCMIILGQQKTVAGVAIFWILFSAFQNGQYASLTAAVPDHVPVRQRATVAGWVGMPQALGLVIGTVLAVLVLASKVAVSYELLGVLLLVLALPFVFTTPDHELAAEHREPLSPRKLAGAFWISPRQYPDFAWAWLTRFLVSLAIAMGTLYLLYFLRDKVHLQAADGIAPATGLLILIAIYTLFVIITAIVFGRISDRRGKRKTIVTVAGIFIALAALLLTFVETWDAAMVAAVLFGGGFGAYLAVDQAIITQVLPAARDRAKDLGVINIALVGPAAIGSGIAGPVVSLGGYPTLYGATAVVGLLGAIGVWKIKSVP